MTNALAAQCFAFLAWAVPSLIFLWGAALAIVHWRKY